MSTMGPIKLWLIKFRDREILRKIVRRLSNVPSAVILKFKIYYAQATHLEHSVRLHQNELYKFHDLDREKALIKLSTICDRYLSLEYDESFGMFSEHLVLLSAISTLQLSFKNILEIGTHNGESSVILAHLFPESKIITIDIPSDTLEFSNTYNRQPYVNDFINRRDLLLEQLHNVNFIPVNSISLTNWQGGEFDLIWIDGAHGYPTIAMDLVNAVRLTRRGGFILIDDVYTDLKESDPIYLSLGAFQSLEAIKDAGLIDDYSLFCKRLGAKFNIPRATKKYVGMIRL